MKIAIVAYPSLSMADREWIEAFRTRHDPQSSRIRVHFTLVFPVEVAPSEVASVTEEVREVAAAARVVRFVVRRTAVVGDAFGSDHHVFLVPEEGAAEIATLHGRLYAGALAAHVPSGVLFVPHMTIGRAREREAAQRLAEQVDVRRAVRGTVERLTLVDVGEARVAAIASHDLAG